MCGVVCCGDGTQCDLCLCILRIMLSRVRGVGYEVYGVLGVRCACVARGVGSGK